ncbi:MAG: peptide-methionine (S)-S-oxide reductase MsrA [Alkalispirochaeta sp.]
MNEQSIILGGGCFWCVEAVYRRLPGVLSAESGYAGGHVEHPTYKQVCTGDTGHAEVVRVTYDADRISLEEILDWFWKAHDPTTLNRQGADVGPQYRSSIMVSDEAQRATAEQSKAAAQEHFSQPIVTEIVAADTFYPAEDYHHDFYESNPRQGYCRMVIEPKLKKLGFDSAPL